MDLERCSAPAIGADHVKVGDRRGREGGGVVQPRLTRRRGVAAKGLRRENKFEIAQCDRKYTWINLWHSLVFIIVKHFFSLADFA